MTVILASGLFPTTERALQYLREADFIACCDGAANACVAAGFHPDVIVGDGDSIAPEVATSFADRIVRIAEQETNDLSKTFHHCLKLGRRDEYVILGATGKREDHALANLALLMDYAEEHREVIMVSDFGTFYPCWRHQASDGGCGAGKSPFGILAQAISLPRACNIPSMISPNSGKAR